MGLISEVKCGRCDRRYSGLRARCPYCGARRGKRGKHAKDYDNAKGRFIIGLILIVVLIAAVVVVIATSMTEANTNDQSDADNQTEQGGTADSDGVTNLEGVGAGDDAGTEDDTDGTDTDGDTSTGEDTDTGDDTSGVTTAVNNVYIKSSWSNSPQQDFTAKVGDTIDFDYVTDPVLEDAEVLWETSDESVFVVLQNGEFTAVGAGTGTLKLTVNGVSYECYVVVK